MDLTGAEDHPGRGRRQAGSERGDIQRVGRDRRGQRSPRDAADHAPERTVYSVKRLMGRGVADVQDELKLFPFRIAAAANQS